MHATRFYKLLYYGCRAWQFSDNGFAGTTVGYVEWDHCWAFDGGDYSGEGCGFKEDVGHGLGYGWIIMQTDARFAVNIAYEKAYTENHLRCNNISREFWDDEWYTWYAWPAGQRPAEASSVKDMIRRNYENDRNLAAIGYGWCWSMMSSYHSREYDPIHKVRWWGYAIGGPDAGTLGWGLDAGDVGITGNRVNLDTYLGATVELMEYCRTNNYPEDNETEQGFILTQTPTELHIQLDTPRFIPGITPCTTPPVVPSFEAPYWVILSGRLKHPKLILKILVNAQQVAVETKKDGDEHKLSHRHLFLYIPNLTH